MYNLVSTPNFTLSKISDITIYISLHMLLFRRPRVKVKSMSKQTVDVVSKKSSKSKGDPYTLTKALLCVVAGHLT